MDVRDGTIVYKLKVINVGSGRVGKTSLVIRFAQNRFSTQYITTLGVDFYSKLIKIDEETSIKMVLFDTQGQENYAPLRKKYYIGAQAAVITYDTTNRQSFEAVDFWINEVKSQCPNIPLFIVGNKVDLKEERQISLEEAEKRYGQNYTVKEASAKTGYGVEGVFTTIAKDILHKGVELL